MIICVIEKDYNRPYDFQNRYLGSPCSSFGEAREIVNVHIAELRDTIYTCTFFVNDGETVTVCDKNTGEVLREYFTLRID